MFSRHDMSISRPASGRGLRRRLWRGVAPLAFIAPPLVALVLNAHIFGPPDIRRLAAAGGVGVFSVSLIVWLLLWPRPASRESSGDTPES